MSANRPSSAGTYGAVPSAAPSPSSSSAASAFDRLRALPVMFTLNAFVRLTGLTRASARVTLSRWNARGLVACAGQRSAVYFNRVRDQHGQQATIVNALMLKYPSATLCGASVLHAHGWTTQIPSALHVAVEKRRTYAQLNGVVLHPRPVQWFREMNKVQALYEEPSDHGAHDPGTSTTDQSREFTAPTYGLRSLKPAWALADAFADTSGLSWQPDEDDLDLLEQDESEVVAACQAMEVDMQEFLPGLHQAAARPRERLGR